MEYSSGPGIPCFLEWTTKQLSLKSEYVFCTSESAPLWLNTTPTPTKQGNFLDYHS